MHEVGGEQQGEPGRHRRRMAMPGLQAEGQCSQPKCRNPAAMSMIAPADCGCRLPATPAFAGPRDGQTRCRSARPGWPSDCLAPRRRTGHVGGLHPQPGQQAQHAQRPQRTLRQHQQAVFDQSWPSALVMQPKQRDDDGDAGTPARQRRIAGRQPTHHAPRPAAARHRCRNAAAPPGSPPIVRS